MDPLTCGSHSPLRIGTCQWFPSHAFQIDREKWWNNSSSPPPKKKKNIIDVEDILTFKTTYRPSLSLMHMSTTHDFSPFSFFFLTKTAEPGALKWDRAVTNGNRLGVPFGSAKVKGAMARIFSIRRQAGQPMSWWVKLSRWFFFWNLLVFRNFFLKKMKKLTYNY